MLSRRSSFKRMKFKAKNSFDVDRDDFLPTLNSIFMRARYFGVAKCGWSIPFCLTTTLFLMLLTLEVYALWKLVKLLALDADGGGAIVGRLSGSIFYGNALLSLLLSSRFATSWERLSEYWLNTELAARLSIPTDGRIRGKIQFVTCFVAFVAFVEHVLSMMSATGFDIPPEEYFERYILTSHGFMIERKDYTLATAIPVFVLSKLATALWNYQDLIIILISMGLTSRYQRMNHYVGHIVKMEKRLQGTQKVGTEQYIQHQVWRRLREAYVRQAALVRKVDRKLGPLVLLTNTNNLYFICLQLYLGIHKDKGSSINRAYYLMSLSWLLLRSCAVVLAASEVHARSKGALAYLNGCPSVAFNVEVKRLKYQLKNDNVALSGLGLFYLRRELLLEVAAAIVKYELVLVQYDS